MQTAYDHRRLRCCLVNISVIISITSASDVIVRLNNSLTLRCSAYCTLPAPSSHLAFLKNSMMLASFYRRAVRTRVCSRFYHCREVNSSEFTLFSPGLSVQLVKWVLGADKAQYCDSCNSKRRMQAFDVKIEGGFARINSNRLTSKKRTTKHRLMSLPSVHLHLILQLVCTHKSSSFTSYKSPLRDPRLH